MVKPGVYPNIPLVGLMKSLTKGIVKMIPFLFRGIVIQKIAVHEKPLQAFNRKKKDS